MVEITIMIPEWKLIKKQTQALITQLELQMEIIRK